MNPDPTQQREEWTIHVCPECDLPDGSPVYCRGDGLNTDWHDERPTEPILVVPASRAEAAEAEVERLKEVLESFVRSATVWTERALLRRARSALSGGREDS